MYRVNVKIDQAAIDAAILDMGLTPAKVQRAAIRAVNEARRWLVSNGTRRLAADAAVPVKAVRDRVRFMAASLTSPRAVIWFGLQNMQAAKLGAPRQTRQGVTVGKRRFPGAFVATMPGASRAGVYRRKTAARLPVETQTVSLQVSVAGLRVLMAQAEQRAFNEFTRLVGVALK